MRLQNKVALITGGGRGLGQATCLRMAREGARIVVADRNEESAVETAEKVRQQGGEATAITFDQAKAAEAIRMVEEAATAYGRIDILFANAGTGRLTPFLDVTPQQWDVVIQVNLNGTFYVAQAVAKQMASQGTGGKIVLTASSGATVYAAQLPHYCVSKAGVAMLAKAMALELGNYRINVNAIMPGVIESGMTGPMLSEEKWRNMLTSQTPVGRWGKPDDIANLVTFLASPEADYINGESIMIDGGSTLHGYPMWFNLDYTKSNEVDWNECFDHFPYKK